MGEIADMMLDGTLCEGCGEFMGDDGDGWPRYCSPDCAAARGMPYTPPDKRPKLNNPLRRVLAKERPRDRGPYQCGHPGCDQTFRTEHAARQHRRDKHGAIDEK